MDVGMDLMLLGLAGMVIGALANGSKLGLGANGVRRRSGALTLVLGVLTTLVGWMLGGWIFGASIATPAAIGMGILGTVGGPWLVAQVRNSLARQVAKT